MKTKTFYWVSALFLFSSLFFLKQSSATVTFVMGPNEYGFLLTKSGTGAILCNPQSQGYVGNVYEVVCKVDDAIKGAQKGATVTLRFATNKGYASRLLQFSAPTPFVIGRPELLFVQTNAVGQNTFIGGESQARFNAAPGPDGKLRVWNGLNNSNLFNQKQAVGSPMMMKMWDQSNQEGRAWVPYDQFKDLVLQKMKGGN